MEDPMQKILEFSLLSKTGDAVTREDGLFIGEHFIAVIDGVTSKSKLLWNGKTSGYHAKETLLASFPRLNPNCDAKEAILFLNQALWEQYDFKKLDYETSYVDRMGANIILFSVAKQEIWSFGDCNCMINGKFYSHEKEIDRIAASVRSMMNHAELRKGKTVSDLLEKDIGREYLTPFFANQLCYSNQTLEFGYAVLDGFPLHLENIKSYPLKEKDHVVLASDGYPFLASSLLETERKLQELREEDPLCITKYKTTKRFLPGKDGFDDRTYIRFIV